MGLTKKKKAFVEEYMTDFNGTQACIRAGYSAKTAYSKANCLLKEPEVKEYLNELMEERKKRLGIEERQLIERVNEIAKYGEKDADRLKANELLLKYLGVIQDKRELNLKGRVETENIVRYEEMTEKELEEILEKLDD